ncbi:hypothetical protein QYE76_015351 [Lolium multiflorum]|uniref:Gag-pol polyprotein n=1 Tax=Lolium multiflorum TaxID=4521 RepID=A0AAD8U7Z6_LOLMU|nr:hypothetical protein QYE76_015351 [Lolium multiflorum]
MVFRTLIDGGASLNVLSAKAFEKLGVSSDRLRDTKSFTGVKDGTTVPIGQVQLPFMVGVPGSYRTEYIDFVVAHINLPHNAILGDPALSRFMAATHHAYNFLKRLGTGGDIITIHCDEEDPARTLECAFKTAAFMHPDGDEDMQVLGGSPGRKDSAPDSILREVNPPAFVAALAEELLVSPPGKRKAELTTKRTATKKVTLGSNKSDITVIIGANILDK